MCAPVDQAVQSHIPTNCILVRDDWYIPGQQRRERMGMVGKEWKGVEKKNLFILLVSNERKYKNVQVEELLKGSTVLTLSRRSNNQQWDLKKALEQEKAVKDNGYVHAFPQCQRKKPKLHWVAFSNIYCWFIGSCTSGNSETMASGAALAFNVLRIWSLSSCASALISMEYWDQCMCLTVHQTPVLQTQSLKWFYNCD